MPDNTKEPRYYPEYPEIENCDNSDLEREEFYNDIRSSLEAILLLEVPEKTKTILEQLDDAISNHMF